MEESYHKQGSLYTYMRCSALLPRRKTLLFIHGIGDSSLSYLPFLNTPLLTDYNLLIPDLLGYGKSAMNDDCCFSLQVALLIQHIQFLEKQKNISFSDLILVAHSMGSIHAMQLCHSSIKDQIKAVVSIEGSITQYGSFVSESVTKVIKQGDFDEWFKKFKEIIVFQGLIKKYPVLRDYYASLKFCYPPAFLQNALEMREVSLSEQGAYTNLSGQLFLKLKLPKIYCYGDKSLCEESVGFLKKFKLPTQVFSTDSHFVMLICFDEFVTFLKDWL
ncbi:MAG: alpha/beta hydrolase [Gammaproteobacteria bacterium]|nr:alpha/beta hydrolase [Gammaproteobacteria bacterium]